MKKIVLFSLFLFFAVSASAEKYIVFIDKNSEASELGKQGEKTSFEAGDVIGAQPLPEGCEELTKCVSPNELQNNVVMIMDLTQDQLNSMFEPEYKTEIIDGAETEIAIGRKKNFDVVAIEKEHLKEVDDVQTVIDSMSTKPVVADVDPVEE